MLMLSYACKLFGYFLHPFYNELYRRIEVHSPKRMEEEVLGKYFRHSKYASFQRVSKTITDLRLLGASKLIFLRYISDIILASSNQIISN